MNPLTNPNTQIPEAGGCEGVRRMRRIYRGDAPARSVQSDFDMGDVTQQAEGPVAQYGEGICRALGQALAGHGICFCSV